MSNLKIKTHFGKYQTNVDSAITDLEENDIVARIWKQDHTVWKPKSTEIINRLGWIDIAERLEDEIKRMTTLKDQLVHEGYTDVLLLGMAVPA